MKKLCILSFGLLSVLYACNKKEKMPEGNGEVYLDLPSTPYRYFEFASSNEDKKATLGRVLFYDRALSVNSSVACASCHNQQLAFSDNVALSRGFENKLTGRNSLSIQNLNISGFFPGGGGGQGVPLFWDGRSSSVQDLIMRPITNHIEMGIDDPEKIPAKLQSAQYYSELFEEAYGDAQITTGRISEAMAMFLLSINSDKTRFDQWQQTQQGLSAQEIRGMQLFNTTYQCTNCHNPTVSGYGSMVGFMDIGLEARNGDDGLGGITKQPADKGKFRIPNLRNIALTGPYMHDGRFATLEDVLEHYSHGIRSNANLDDRLKENGQPLHMNIPDEDKKAIIAFLGTLTDYYMITDSKFSNPFKTR